MWQIIVSAISPLIGICGLYLAWTKFREDNLRKGDVLSWANEAIRLLQNLTLIGRLPERLDATSRQARLTEIIFDTSVLVERGRLFFKNEILDQWGAKKPSSYRGYRPQILDHLVLAHQIACHWHESFENRDPLTNKLAEKCCQEFVSLVQREIGRSRTACVEAKKGGTGTDIDQALREMRDDAGLSV